MVRPGGRGSARCSSNEHDTRMRMMEAAVGLQLLQQRQQRTGSARSAETPSRMRRALAATAAANRCCRVWYCAGSRPAHSTGG